MASILKTPPSGITWGSLLPRRGSGLRQESPMPSGLTSGGARDSAPQRQKSGARRRSTSIQQAISGSSVLATGRPSTGSATAYGPDCGQRSSGMEALRPLRQGYGGSAGSTRKRQEYGGMQGLAWKRRLSGNTAQRRRFTGVAGGRGI